MPPIRLTDLEIELVLAAARPLPIHARDLFLQEVADALAALPVVGLGGVSRVCRDVQKRFFDPPTLSADDD
jgi:hypothetical protein